MLRSLRNKGPSHNSLFHESSNLSRTESLSTLQESSESFISRQCRRCAVCRVVGTISASCGFFELVPSGNRAKHHRRIADRIAEESSKQSGKKVVSLCMCLYACMHVCPSVCLSVCMCALTILQCSQIPRHTLLDKQIDSMAVQASGFPPKVHAAASTCRAFGKPTD